MVARVRCVCVCILGLNVAQVRSLLHIQNTMACYSIIHRYQIQVAQWQIYI